MNYGDGRRKVAVPVPPITLDLGITYLATNRALSIKAAFPGLEREVFLAAPPTLRKQTKYQKNNHLT